MGCRWCVVATALVLVLACGDTDSGAESEGAPVAAEALEAPEAYETPGKLAAADELPAELLKGPDFSVDPKVSNDGFMNRYLLRSSFGNLQVVSTPLLRKRQHEVLAIRHIQDLSKSKEFAEGLGRAGQGAARGAVNLVTNPVDTASSAASGVGKLFGMAKASVTGEAAEPSPEDARWKQATGYAQTKRDYAKEMGVDVYTRNALLQKALDDIAWTGWAGGVTGGLAMIAIPGAAGVVVSVSKNTDLMNRIDVTRPPSEVRKANAAKMRKLGVSQAVIDQFLEDSPLSPTEQSLVVVSLEDMEGVADRQDFFEFAAGAPDPDVATFVVLAARMYGQYHAKHEPLTRFQRIGARLVARTADGGVVVIHPTDHLFWTEALEGIAGSVDPALGDAPRKLVWVGRVASDDARQGLAAHGWELREGALAALIPD